MEVKPFRKKTKRKFRFSSRGCNCLVKQKNKLTSPTCRIIRTT